MNDQQTLAIKTNGLTKRYGQAIAVNGLDLQVKAGQCYGLLGHYSYAHHDDFAIRW